MLHYTPYLPKVIADPYPIYKRLRDEAPAYYVEEYDCWFLSRFQDVWDCEIDTKSFTVSDGLLAMQLAIPVAEQKARSEMFADMEFGNSISTLDPPAHTPYRSAVSAPFKPAAAASLEGLTRQIVRRFMDRFIDQGEADVVGDLAMQTSVRIACHLIGLPEADVDFFVERINRSFERDPGVIGNPERATLAVMQVYEYLARFVEESRKQRLPFDCATNTLLEIAPSGKPLTDPDIQSMLYLMLVGGTETLPKALSSAVYRLWQHPDQRAELAADPKLIPQAFNEALRYDMPTQMLGRRVAREKEVRGQKLMPGQGVLYLFAAANRDEREFPEPDRFDIHRNAKRILTFGAGAHMCLGAHVARMEGRVMLEELLARIPDYEVDETNAVRLTSEMFQGFRKLPLRFAAQRKSA